MGDLDLSGTGAESALDYPVGGTSQAKGGRGIFRDADDEPLLVWVDLDVNDRMNILRSLREEGAEIAVQHWDSYCHILIMAPASVKIFDMYCHPGFMTSAQYRRYRKQRRNRLANGEEGGREIWQEKVMLKETWVSNCVESGTFLGADDNWAGLRVGGPLPPEDQMKVDSPPGPTAEIPDAPEINIIPATQQERVASSPAREPSAEDEDEAAEAQTALKNDGRSFTEVDHEVDHEQMVTEDTNTSGRASREDFDLEDAVVDQQTSAVASEQIEAGDVVSSSDVGKEAAMRNQLEVVPIDDDLLPIQLSPSPEPPDTPVTIMRERDDGRLEVVSREESEEPEETVEEREPEPLANKASDSQTTNHTGSLLTPAGVNSLSGQEYNRDAEAAEEAEVELGTLMDADNGAEAAGYPQAEVKELLEPVAEATVPLAESHEMEQEPAEEAPTVPASRIQTEAFTQSPVQIGQMNGHVNAEAGPSTPRRSPIHSVVEPRKLFEGYRFWVDLKRGDRKDIIRRLKEAGGEIVAEYEHATHVLVYDPKGANWTSIIYQVVKQGVWFMSFRWALNCLNDGVRHPELGQHIPGGAPVSPKRITMPSSRSRRPTPHHEHGSSSVSPTKARADLSSTSPVQPVASSSRTPDDPYDARQISRHFEKAHSQAEGDLDEIVGFMQVAMPNKYSDAKWSGLYARWSRRTGRFSNIPRNQPTEAQLRPVLEAIGTPVTQGIMTTHQASQELHDHFPTLSNWLKTGHVLQATPSEVDTAASVSNDQGSHDRKRRLDAAELSPDGGTTTGAPRKKAIVKQMKVSAEDMGKIFRKFLPMVESGTSAANIGHRIYTLYKDYSPATWSTFFGDWRGGRGRFAKHGPLYMTPKNPEKNVQQEESMAISQSSTDVKVEPDPHSLDDTRASQAKEVSQSYTEKETAEMGRYVVDRLPEKLSANAKCWARFTAEFGSHRPADAWAQRFKSSFDDTLALAEKNAEERDRGDELRAVYFGPRVKNNNDDATAATAATKGKKAVEVIELLTDSDDDEYVDMTALDSD
ncbi:hypothetical protein BD324DRAFT_650247 [Kockovaella imperatae]|uniref:BRCT domain-containing protein n=1 Tax=Kockovaella imperatae TaxID=4999 RepID=A0A1Y1UI03_9TREE|nr:hypothetical protein BD324DRAFT_650247 [Kockovaella imperatae]ORX37693.1 hypothetical protein BD324DRAFT_650247 [Kockovaella imperatae]